MPIVVSTSKLRRPHSSVNRSSRTRLSRTSSDKPFVPPGHVKHDTVAYHEDPQPPSFRSRSHERPVRVSHSSSLKPFFPAGTVKHAPVPASPPSFPLEGGFSSGGRGRSGAGASSLTPFFPSGTTHHPTSSTPPRRPPPFPLERDLHPNFLDEDKAAAGRSEYAQAYKAWDVPPPRNPVLPTHTSVLSNFDVHLSTAQWESETRGGYPAHAPRPTPQFTYKPTHAPPSTLPQSQSQPSTLDAPPSPRLSEHKAQFAWKEGQGNSSSPPFKRAPNSHPPYARDTTLAPPLSEYDEQTKTLRERLKKLRERGEDGVVAGRGSGAGDGAKGKPPTFFAYEQSAEAPAPVPTPAPYPVGETETHAAFHRHPNMQQNAIAGKSSGVEGTRGGGGGTSRIFHVSDGSRDVYRGTSEYKDTFRVPQQTFQPPAEDHRVVEDYEDREVRSTSYPTAPTNPRPPMESTSEYTRKYIPFPSHPTPRQPIVPAPAAALNLFDKSGRLEEQDGEDGGETEYQREFGTDGGVSMPHRFHAPISSHPPQFAWAPPPPPPAPASPSRHNNNGYSTVKSEYLSQFTWKEGDNEGGVKNSPAKPSLNPHPPTAPLPLDPLSYPTSNWKSELTAQYDNKQLRERTRQLMDRVAGVRTKRVGGIPPYYAWEEEARPPSPAKNYAPLSPDHYLSEYGGSFNPHPTPAVTLAHAPAPPPTLNLFDGEEGKTANKTEAQAKYTPPPLSTPLPTPTVPGQEGGIPAQFAWPLLAPPRPPSPPRPSHPSAPMEVSEYASKYITPTPAPAVKPHGQSNKNNDRPVHTAADFFGVGDQAGEEEEKKNWQAESRRYGGDKGQGAQSTAPAGLISVKDQDLPPFFAWVDTQMQAPPPPPIPHPTPGGEDMTSEYRDAFHKHPAPTPTLLQTSKGGAYRPEPTFSLGTTDTVSFSTETHSAYRPPTPSALPAKDSASFLPPPPPHHFAWTLDGGATLAPPPPPPPHPSTPFDATTEYNEQFSRPHLSSHTHERSYPVKAIQKTDPLGVLGGDDEAKWGTEYTAHFIPPETQRISQCVSGRSERDTGGPAYFAWGGQDAKPAHAKEPSLGERARSMPSLSEQGERFAPPPSNPHPARFTAAPTRGRFEGGGGVEGVSETKDKFGVKDAKALQRKAKTEDIRHDGYGGSPSLEGTNLSLRHSDVVVAEMNRQAGRQVARAEEGDKQVGGVVGGSEMRTQFSWPAAAPAATPTLASHKSKVVIGGAGNKATKVVQQHPFASLSETHEAFGWPRNGGAITSAEKVGKKAYKLMNRKGPRGRSIPDRSYLFQVSRRPASSLSPSKSGQLDGAASTLMTQDSLDVPNTPVSTPAPAPAHAAGLGGEEAGGVIPSLRGGDIPAYLRSRSAPPRRSLASSKTLSLSYTNPLLMYPRYPPAITPHNPFATETQSAYRWGGAARRRGGRSISP